LSRPPTDSALRSAYNVLIIIASACSMIFRLHAIFVGQTPK
jgi:hypothetical protein